VSSDAGIAVLHINLAGHEEILNSVHVLKNNFRPARVGSRGFELPVSGDLSRNSSFLLSMLFNLVLLGMLILDDERESLVLEKHTAS
jgi:hypothetical protein